MLISEASRPGAGVSGVSLPVSLWIAFRSGSQASALSHLKGAVMGGKSPSLAFGLRLSLSRDSFVAGENPFITSKNFKAECIKIFEERERIISLHQDAGYEIQMDGTKQSSYSTSLTSKWERRRGLRPTPQSLES